MDTTNKLISVICTVYNTEKYLEECLDHILNQSYPNLEIIIVDDGSTDRSSSILETCTRNYPQIKLIKQSNQGHSEARNVGLSVATGECVFFVDSDDVVHPRAIEILYDIMQANDADISIGRVHIGSCPPDFDSLLQSSNTKKCTVLDSMQALHLLVDEARTTYQNSLSVSICATWNKLFKKSLFDDIKFPTGRVHDDNATAHRLLYKARTVTISFVKTYFYRQHHNGIVAKGVYDNDMIWAMEDRIDFFNEKGLDELLEPTYARYAKVLKYAYEKSKSPELFDKIQIVRDQMHFSFLGGTRSCRTIGLYYRTLKYIDGISTWIYNFANSFKDKYYVVVYVAKIDPRLRTKLSNVANVVEIKGDQVYECDVLIDNYIIDDVPECIHYNKILKIIHSDFAASLQFTNYEFDKSFKYIAVSDIVAEKMRNKFGVDCIASEGLLVRVRPTRKRVLHLVSATRFTPDKGFGRMLKLASMLKDKGILFEWRVYCDSDIGYEGGEVSYPDIIRLPAVDNNILMSYMADADYVVQLSYSEGFGMAVHESLMMDTPVIVSDIPVFTKYIQDGSNGYIIPKNMDEFDVTKLLKIPKGFVHISNFSNARDKWEHLIEEA